MTESCTCGGGCLVPLVEIVGTMTAEAAEKWAASEGVELRTTWNGRLAVGADDARRVYEQAEQAAEVVRARNAAKMAATLAAAAPVLPGTPVPDGLGDLTALEVMTLDKVTDRLDHVDALRKEFAKPGNYVYHPLNPEQG